MENKGSSRATDISKQLDLTLPLEKPLEDLATKIYELSALYKKKHLDFDQSEHGPVGSIDQLQKFGFSDIHIHYHIKGRRRSSLIKLTPEIKLQHNFDLESFNKINQIVTKSKSPIVNQTELKSKLLSLTGFLLVESFQSENIKFLIVLSNGELFKPDADLQERTIKFISQNKLNLTYFLTNKIFEYEYNVVKKSKIALNSLEENKVPNSSHNLRLDLLGELLNTLKHELSNPLFGIQLSSQSIIENDYFKEDQEFIENVSKGASKCLEIINNFEYIFNNDRKLEDVNIYKLTHDVLSSVKSISKTTKKQIDIEEKEIVIQTNPTLLAQVLFNLFVNSVEAIQDQSNQKINISIRNIFNVLIISVSDNGPSLTNTRVSNLFKPFFTTKKNGNGLGLSLSKKLIENIGGKLFYSPSHNGFNTTFHILLKR